MMLDKACFVKFLASHRHPSSFQCRASHCAHRLLSLRLRFRHMSSSEAWLLTHQERETYIEMEIRYCERPLPGTCFRPAYWPADKPARILDLLLSPISSANLNAHTAFTSQSVDYLLLGSPWHINLLHQHITDRHLQPPPLSQPPRHLGEIVHRGATGDMLAANAPL
ncbi:hypothetical protein EJ02DRAFT_29881 [Clathrospora elynae]|uniref:Uncharacterized protein n=1 Tax=Clathrospora elynae TaxID=706981 RepID=A0A6A5SEZ3_9PLEO|nr:hypothetical protein EJ02DRAFT_29881 [Clathrospora elynae]